MLLGVNADPRHTLRADTVSELGIASVRYPVRYRHNYQSFARNLSELGVDVLPIVTNETFTSKELRDRNWRSGFERVKLQYPKLQYIQVGNESDQPGSESSWQQDSGEYSGMLAAARLVFPLGAGVTVVAAGMVSGNPAYLDGVDLSTCDAIAVHPYTQSADSVGKLLGLYTRFKLPIWVTEFGAEHSAFYDEHERAVWHSEMVVALADLGVRRAYVFCYSDKMHPGFGLVDGSGELYESYAAILNAT